MSSVVLVAQIKGGCAKSTIAMQVIAPWILSRQGAVKLIEIDQHNKDSSDYHNTEICTQQIDLPERDSYSYAATRLMQEIVVSDTSIVVDLGGNATASEMIEEFGRNGISSFIDLIIVPVTGSGRDVMNAEATINEIRRSFTNFTSPILLAYSRSPTENIGRLRFDAPDIFSLVDNLMVSGPLIIPQKACFALSRYMLKTAWELSLQAETLIEDIQDQQSQAKREKDVGKASKLITMRSIVEDSASLAPFFERAFTELDALLPLTEAQRNAPKAKQKVVDEPLTSAGDAQHD